MDHTSANQTNSDRQATRRKKLTVLAIAAAMGAALIAGPALAASHSGGYGGRGGHGGFGGGGLRGGGLAAHSFNVGRGAGFRGRGVAFRRAPFVARGGFVARHRVFAGRRGFYGYGAYAGYSCWRWAPTAYGLRRVWVCDYPYALAY